MSTPRRGLLAVLILAVVTALAGCGPVTEHCWGDKNGVNYCTSFTHERPWTGGVAMTSARPTQPGVQVSDQLSTSTGIVSTLGGSMLGEAAQHVVIAP